MLKKIFNKRLILWSIGLIAFAYTLTDLYISYHDRVYFRLKRDGYIDHKVALSELAPDDKTMIAFTFGQSNASNSGEVLYTPHNKGKVLNYAKGTLYEATDPLIGTDGEKGNIWGRMADMLIDSGLYKKVILIPIAIGGTDATCWASGMCHQKLVSALQDLQKHNIKLTHILFYQGESENTSDPVAYRSKIEEILQTVRLYDKVTPFYFAIVTLNYHIPAGNGIDTTIENAQRKFIQDHENVLAGPNTDQFIYAVHRYDGQHLSEYGMNMVAAEWVKALREKKE